jgi:copper oxidase (laccase) domain-containing protein
MQRVFKLPTYDVKCTYVGRSSGGFNDRYTDKAIADKNLQLLAGSFGSTSATLTLAEGHSKIREVGPGAAETPCDVLITTVPRHALLLRPADCIPLVIYSHSRPLIALVHCGRTSLDEGIVHKTIDYLAAHMDEPVTNLHAYLGPGIKRKSYALPPGNDAKHSAWRRHTRTKAGKVYFDLFGFVKNELVRLGIPKAAISVSGIDTATHPGYYSHYQATRHGEQNGRNGFAVAIIPKA